MDMNKTFVSTPKFLVHSHYWTFRELYSVTTGFICKQWINSLSLSVLNLLIILSLSFSISRTLETELFIKIEWVDFYSSTL